MYNSILEEQTFLSEEGIPFNYTDTIDNQSRKDLVEFMVNWRKEHPKHVLI